MLNRFKHAVANVMGGVSSLAEEKGEKLDDETPATPVLEVKFPYTRPDFLQLNADEVQVSADHCSRPILVPRQFTKLPWNAGYAEVINAGKTKLNEDQARADILPLYRGVSRSGVVLKTPGSPQRVTQTPDLLKPEQQNQGNSISENEEAHANHTGITAEALGPSETAVTQNELKSEKTEIKNDANEHDEVKNSMNEVKVNNSGDTCSSKDTSIDQSMPLTSASNKEDPEHAEELLKDEKTANMDKLSFTYFAIFDGHAGTGASLMAANLLHTIIQAQMNNVLDLIIARRHLEEAMADKENTDCLGKGTFGRVPGILEKLATVTEESLVTGALEMAFHEMDETIKEERKLYKITGGCTALAAIFFSGKVYIANAGDSRAIISREDELLPVSNDFTPIAERQRIQYLGYLQPDLLHGEFTHLEFPRRMTVKDIGKRMLYRDAWMTGWSCKTIEEDDTKFPLIHGEGKRARVLATIGVTRGFGDHGLMVYNSEIAVKPFLLPTPEVKVYDLSSYPHKENDVLIMGSDGLWDVTTNARAAHIVQSSLSQFEPQDHCRYTSAAQDLVMYARGLLKKGWRTSDDTSASGDDITVFVIPLSGKTIGSEDPEQVPSDAAAES